MELGERIRQARTSRNLSVSALADASGLSKGFISQVESGRSNPSIASLRRIATSLQLPLGDVLGDVQRADPAFNEREEAPKTPAVHRAVAAPGLSSLWRVEPGSGSGRYMSRLAPGASLSAPALERTSSRGFCLIVEGALEFSQSPAQALLGPGDSVTFDPGRRYRFENKGPAIALLYLDLPAYSGVPHVLDRPLPANPEPTAGKAASSKYSADGPLRLAAMRAERHTKGAR